MCNLREQLNIPGCLPSGELLTVLGWYRSDTLDSALRSGVSDSPLFSLRARVFGQSLSPGDRATSLSSILGAAEGWKVKFKQSLKKKKKKNSIPHEVLHASFTPVCPSCKLDSSLSLSLSLSLSVSLSLSLCLSLSLSLSCSERIHRSLPAYLLKV